MNQLSRNTSKNQTNQPKSRRRRRLRHSEDNEDMEDICKKDCDHLEANQFRQIPVIKKRITKRKRKKSTPKTTKLDIGLEFAQLPKISFKALRNEELPTSITINRDSDNKFVNSLKIPPPSISKIATTKRPNIKKEQTPRKKLQKMRIEKRGMEIEEERAAPLDIGHNQESPFEVMEEESLFFDFNHLSDSERELLAINLSHPVNAGQSLLDSISHLRSFMQEAFPRRVEKDRSSRGLSDNKLNRIPIRTYEDKIKDCTELFESCPICYEEFKNKDLVRDLSCGHFYHTTCVDIWLKKKSVCPICLIKLRKDLK